jgi:hypothetical protein
LFGARAAPSIKLVSGGNNVAVVETTKQKKHGRQFVFQVEK